ncbi:MAG: hypothetical protein EBX52_10060, partial [Proteobacteria bacterium]|nr:hypothetical protein [Pseudomonadota bacterium]
MRRGFFFFPFGTFARIHAMQTEKRPVIHTPPPGPKAKALIDRDHAVTSPSYIKEYPLVVSH